MKLVHESKEGTKHLYSLYFQINFVLSISLINLPLSRPFQNPVNWLRDSACGVIIPIETYWTSPPPSCFDPNFSNKQLELSELPQGQILLVYGPREPPTELSKIQPLFGQTRREKKNMKGHLPGLIRRWKSSIRRRAKCHRVRRFKGEEVCISSAHSPRSPSRVELVWSQVVQEVLQLKTGPSVFKSDYIQALVLS